MSHKGFIQEVAQMSKKCSGVLLESEFRHISGLPFHQNQLLRRAT